MEEITYTNGSGATFDIIDSMDGDLFAVNDVSGTAHVTIDADGIMDATVTELNIKDKEHNEEWGLSISKGRIVIKPKNQGAMRRHNLNNLIDDRNEKIDEIINGENGV